MSARTYTNLMRVIAVALAALIAVSVARELPLYIPLMGVMAALVVAAVSRSYVREIMTDERNRRIDEKATAVAYRVYTVAAAAVALVVLMLRSRLPPWAGVAGETLAYSICGLMLIHLASSWYFGKKL